MELTENNKRIHPRIPLKNALHWKVRGKATFDNCLTENVSLGGLGFNADTYMAPQTILMMEFKLLSHMCNPVGRIAWVNPIAHANRYHYGIEFIESNATQQENLKQFISMQLEKK